MSDAEEDRRRISELESEVASLRARFSSAEAPDVHRAADAQEATDAAFVATSRGKIATVAGAIVVVALALALAVFYAISTAIDSVAPKAADYLSPEDKERGSEQPPRAPPPPREIPRAPGL